METVTDLPLMSIFIVLSEREKTQYGPSYGVVRGLRMASWRRNTWVHVAKASSTKTRGDDDVCGGTGRSCWANWRSRVPRRGKSAAGRWGEEFPRKTETTTIDHFRGTTTNVGFQSTPDTEEDKREVLEPVQRVGLSVQSSFQLAVKAFNETVGTWMIRGGPDSS